MPLQQTGGVLPPLRTARPSILENASGKLIRDLKQLKDASTKLPGIEGYKEHSLCTITPISKRANACIEEVNIDAVSSETPHQNHLPRRSRRRSYLTTEDDAGGILGAKVAFDDLLTEIHEALHGGDATARTVRRGDRVSDRLPPRGSRYYKISLPSHPTEVTVALEQISGRTPALWGSTSHELPDSHHHSLKGKGDKIVYRHVLEATEDELGQVDRRNAVPTCRELFVAIEAQMGECSYVLAVDFSHINVVLSRKELHAQVLKNKRTWATKIQELQREPGARSEFESHVTHLRKTLAQQKRDMADGIDYVQQNITSARSQNSKLKALELHKRALQNFARQDAASSRRLEKTKPRICNRAQREDDADDNCRIGHQSLHKVAQQRQLDDVQLN